jgi:hypothetical protein
MNRRDVIGALARLGGAAIARPVTALAQQPKRLRVGTANILPKERSGTLPGFEERMTQLGYEQGKNFDLEFVQVPSVLAFREVHTERDTTCFAFRAGRPACRCHGRRGSCMLASARGRQT